MAGLQVQQQFNNCSASSSMQGLDAAMRAASQQQYVHLLNFGSAVAVCSH